jgi:transglutaminase-like putative cysteine protease
MKYRIRHSTIFEYAHPVTFVYNVLHLTPRNLPWQAVGKTRLCVDPVPTVKTERMDYFGNHATYCTVQETHQSMRVTMESEVDVQARSMPAAEAPAWDTVGTWLQSRRSSDAIEAVQFCFDSTHVKRSDPARGYVLPSCLPGRSTHQVATDLMHRIHQEFKFDAAATNISTPVIEVIENRKGVCQDFAHLMIACLRSAGIPARYNSGYIRTRPPEGKPRLAGADASHAWVGVYCPVNGWLDLDPTNGKAADEDFITVGWGRDYQDVSPVAGVLFGGGDHSVKAEVDVVPETEFIQSQQQQQQQ